MAGCTQKTQSSVGLGCLHTESNRTDALVSLKKVSGQALNVVTCYIVFVTYKLLGADKPVFWQAYNVLA